MNGLEATRAGFANGFATRMRDLLLSARLNEEKYFFETTRRFMLRSRMYLMIWIDRACRGPFRSLKDPATSSTEDADQKTNLRLSLWL